MGATNRGERGVSPVVAAILLIAVTVILATAFAGYAMGLGGVISDDVRAGVSVDVQSETSVIEIRVITLEDAEYVNVTGDPYDHLDTTGPTALAAEDLRELGVGDRVRIDRGDLDPAGYEGTVTVVAAADESEAVVSSRDYDFA